MKTGNARNPVLSPSLVKLLTAGWTIGSVDFNATQLRTGFGLIALLTEDELVRMARDFSRELQMIQPEVLRRDFATIVAGSPENAQTGAGAPAGSCQPAPGCAGRHARRPTWTSLRSI